ncbi:undecaprenyl-phosphate alpha-N-acetylglucosaminyl 1-phosphate transferase [Zafaria cholistanensis]|uniref:Undecaprenyl-phosphate alpha-N-acetylglucosaminyl 1-phosphate transferase n=1 Tax=Zafaria cholistanensis TaxID=1682741 RepID=A0A5A7NVK8_9MICC|nr:MraY family glycosyltransferase [Zafaria cholistanensis]GER24188.1 undecaprenyl-phosphate alpha-N-acetylglucosaminyl 1-phosphate transferase [Zafaria cholistanensis]
MRVYILLMGVAFAASYLLTPVMRRLGLRVMGSAPLRDRDVHLSPIPKLGGVAMIAGILAGLLVASRIPFLEGVFSDTDQVLGVVAAAGLILLIGVADDIWDLRWYVKFAGQTLVGLTVAFSGVRLEAMPVGWIHISSEPLQIVLTTFLVVLTMNAINFVDGLDGLAAGMAAIGAAAFFIYCYLLARTINEYDHSNYSALLMALLLGSCLGFLPHNFNPAKIFMGESGAMIIGLMMAVATIAVTTDLDALEGFRFRNVPAYMPIILPIAVILLPMADLVLAIIRRTARGRSPFSADRGHLHHKLVDGGYSHRQAVLMLYLWSALVAFGTVSFNFFDPNVLIPVLAVLLVGAAWLTMRPLLRHARGARDAR